MGKKIIKDYEFPLVTYLHYWGINSIEKYEQLYNLCYNKVLKQVHGISNDLLFKILNKMDCIALNLSSNPYLTNPLLGGILSVNINNDILMPLKVLNKFPKKFRGDVLSLFKIYNSRHFLEILKRIFSNNNKFFLSSFNYNLGLIPYERMQNLLRYSCKDLSFGVILSFDYDYYNLSKLNNFVYDTGFDIVTKDIKHIRYMFLDFLNGLTINFIELMVYTTKKDNNDVKLMASYVYKYNLNEFINNCYTDNNYFNNHIDVYTALLVYLSESNKLYSNQLYKEGRTKTKKEKVINVGINEDDLIVYPYYLDSYLKKKGESEGASHPDTDPRSYTSTEKSPHLRSGHVRHLSNGREVEVKGCVIHKDKYKKPFHVAHELK